MKGKISLKKEIANIIDNAEHLGDRKVKAIGITWYKLICALLR